MNSSIHFLACILERMHTGSSLSNRTHRKTVYAVSSGGLMYVGERTAFMEGPPSKKMDHLVCFLPGLLALGHFHGIETGAVILSSCPATKNTTSINSWIEHACEAACVFEAP